MDALRPFLTGNATYRGYGPADWYSSLAKFVAANPYGAKISSLDRDITRQTQLWEEALRKYGSEAAARKWVAPPGSSRHNKGTAADLKFATAQARAWAHENAAAHGLAFPMKHEPWHVEFGPRGGVTMPPEANVGAPGTSVVSPMPGGYGGAPQPAQGGAPMPALPTPPVAPNPLAGAISSGFSGLAGSLARSAQAVAPQVPQRSGPVGLGGPETAQLAPQFQALLEPAITPRSKTLADMLKALGGATL